MRVIAGVARGRALRGPKSPDTRPTSDLVRGAIFSMLEARGASFTRVLDLYAGTGALGIEALSRGADTADFIERDRRACAVISANLDLTGFCGVSTLTCAALPTALSRVSGAFGLIFLDPPYGVAGLAAMFERLAAGELVAADTTIVYEHDRRTMPPEQCGGLSLQVTRAHGSTGFSLYYAAVRTEPASESDS
jgi:16S rRNA (guanine966-N2)-methyltransferase